MQSRSRLHREPRHDLRIWASSRVPLPVDLPRWLTNRPLWPKPMPIGPKARQSPRHKNWRFPRSNQQAAKRHWAQECLPQFLHQFYHLRLSHCAIRLKAKPRRPSSLLDLFIQAKPPRSIPSQHKPGRRRWLRGPRLSFVQLRLMHKKTPSIPCPPRRTMRWLRPVQRCRGEALWRQLRLGPRPTLDQMRWPRPSQPCNAAPRMPSAHLGPTPRRRSTAPSEFRWLMPRRLRRLRICPPRHQCKHRRPPLQMAPYPRCKAARPWE